MSIPPIIALIERQRLDLMAREEEHQRRLRDAWLDIVERAVTGDLEALARDIEARQRDNRPVTIAAVMVLPSYLRLISSLQRAARTFVPVASLDITGEQTAYTQAGIDNAIAALRTQHPDIRPRVLPAQQFAARVGMAQDGSMIDALLNDAWLYAANGTASSLANEAARAQGTGALVTAGRGGLALGLQQVLTIARSEEWHLYREVQDVQYQRSGVVRAYRRLSRRDGGTCAACLAADGWIYPEGDDFETHPNCRCIKVPLLIGQDAPDYPSGAEWFAQQSADDQRRILGAGRYKLYQAGTPLTDFARVRRVDGAYATLTPRPIKDFT